MAETDNVFKSITPEELEAFNKAWPEVFEAIGDYVEKIGRLEKDRPTVWKTFQQVGNNPDRIFGLVDQIPKRERGKVYERIGKLLIYMNMLNRLDKMSADDKIALGMAVKNFARVQEGLKAV